MTIATPNTSDEVMPDPTKGAAEAVTDADRRVTKSVARAMRLVGAPDSTIERSSA